MKLGSTARMLLVLGLGALAEACSGGGGGTDASEAGADAADATPGDVPVDTAPMERCEVAGGAACFELPAAPLVAIEADAGVTPDFSCTPAAPAVSTMDIAVNGTVENFENHGRLPDANVAVFRDDDFTASPLASATTDGTGHFTLTLPTGTPNRLYWRTRAPAALDTFVIRNPIDVTMATLMPVRESVAQSTAGGLAALIGMQRVPGTAIVAGQALDCRRRLLSEAVVTLSSTSSLAAGMAPTFVAGAQAYYFSAAPDLPTRRVERTTTNTNGLFLLIQVPTGMPTAQYYVQVWGFLSALDMLRGRDGLVLIAETPVHLRPDVMLLPDMTPRQLP